MTRQTATRETRLESKSAEGIMLWLVFALLFVLWLLGYGLSLAGSMIHLLLAAALVVLVLNLVRQLTAES